MEIIKGKKIVLGVSGSIAVYKTVSLASKLAQSGALVEVILTESAAKLVAPLTFSSVTGRRAFTDQDLWKTSDHVPHIELGESNDIFLIAPATANTIAKLARGIADNLLTVSALASRTPVLVAPAMDGGMYAHPATQENLKILRDRGISILGPKEGHLASGLEGKGRMLEPEELFGYLRLQLGREGVLAGKKVVVTAGGTREPIDPVRHITNRSSGKQGYALAQAALDQGALVSLISAPTALRPPVGARVIPVVTADQMQDAVFAEVEQADLLLMAAAVADFKLAQPAGEKIKKESGDFSQLPLEPTADILAAVADYKERPGMGPKLTVGFAAESERIVANAEEKLHQKKLDMIVVNDITREDAGFEVDTNQVILLWADGRRKDLPLMSKEEAAENIILESAKMLDQAD